MSEVAQRPLRKRRLTKAALVLVLGVVSLNALAYQHARAMLCFAEEGERTARPQALSVVEKAGVLLTGVRVPRPENGRTPDDVGLGFETFTFETVDGVRLEAWLVPAEPARGVVLLFHGYGAAKSSLLEEAQVFHEFGWDALLVDFRGSGGSEGNETTIGYREAEDVAAAFRFAKSRRGDLPVVLYGQSMGAAAVLRSLDACDVRPDGVILESVFDRLRTTVGNRFELMGLPASPGSELLLFWGGVRSGFSGFEHNPSEYASCCACPALMLHGGTDRNATLDEARAVQRSLPGGAELEVFPGAGHLSLLGADEGRWRDAVASSLSNLQRD